MRTIQLNLILIVSAVLLLSNEVDAQAGWSPLESGTAQTLRSITSSYPDRLYAVGDSGTFLYSSDQGIRWIRIPTNIMHSLNAISFANADTGFVVGDSGIILKVTRNSVQQLTSGTRRNLHGVFAAPDLQNRAVFVVGDSGTVMRTIDRGSTWRQLPGFPSGLNLYGVTYSPSSNRTYVVGDSGAIFRSTNIGVSWARRLAPNQYDISKFYSVISSASMVVVTGEDGVVLTSTDHAETWWSGSSVGGTPLRHGFISPTSVSWPSVRRIWAVGGGGTVVMSVDSGMVWGTRRSGTTEDLFSIIFLDSLRGYAVGSRGTILKTVTGGENPPTLTVSSPVLDFGSIPIGSSRRVFLRVTNNSEKSVTITGASSFTDEVTVDIATPGIPPLSTQGYAITVTPLASGNINGVLTFHTTAADSAFTVMVRARVIEAPRPTGWNILNPIPSGNLLYGMAFDSDRRSIFAIGQLGTIVRSENLGDSWIVDSHAGKTTHTLYGVSAAGGGNVIAVGEYGTIVRTTDNGNSWSSIESGTTDNLIATSFVSPFRGIIVGFNPFNGRSSIHTTHDGAKTWRHHQLDQGIELTGVSMASDNLALAVGLERHPGYSPRGVIFRTSDGGITWQRRWVESAGMTAVRFLNQSVAVAVGAQETILRSTDGGVQWVRIISSSSTYSATFTGMAFNNENRGCVISSFGDVLLTSDGGRSWTGSSNISASIPISVTYAGAEKLIVAGIKFSSTSSGAYLWYSTDGGSRWSEYEAPAGRLSWAGVATPMANVIFTVGDSGRVLRSTDGGRNWEQQLRGTLYEKIGVSFKGISFTDENTGTVVGAQGIILRTTDAGQRWISQESGTTQVLTAVSFADHDHGLAVGKLGTLLSTRNGGANWTRQIDGLETNLNDVVMSDINTSIVVGDRGLILHSSDGGGSWIQPWGGTNAVLYGVDLHADTAYAVGADGTILRSTDGGARWEKQSSGVMTTLYDVVATTGSVVTVVGNEGVVLRTTNSGATWTRQWIGVRDNLRKISFADAYTGTIVGTGGLILHTTSGGVVSVDPGKQDLVPRTFVLEQNYPNPFNPITSIRVQIPHRVEITLTVYDVLGREVARLATGVHEPGSHVIPWDASGFPSGVYFYRFHAGDFTATRKMLLIR